MRTLIIVCLALGAAAVNGLAQLIEQRSTGQVPRRTALSPRLLLDLLRRSARPASPGSTSRSRFTAPALACESASVVVVPAGVIALAHRAPRAGRPGDESPQRPGSRPASRLATGSRL